MLYQGKTEDSLVEQINFSKIKINRKLSGLVKERVQIFNTFNHGFISKTLSFTLLGYFEQFSQLLRPILIEDIIGILRLVDYRCKSSFEFCYVKTN